MGRRTMAEALGNPERFTQEVAQDFTQRLELNNVPVRLESLELRELKTFMPTRTVSNQIVEAPPAFKR